MSEHLLRVTREELQSAGLVQLGQQKVASVLEVVSRLFSRLHELNSVEKEVTYGILRRLSSDIELLVKVRLVKSIITGDTSPESVDSIILKTLQALARSENIVLSPLTVRYGTRIAFLFSKNCEVSGRSYRRGDLALLEPWDLVLANIHECGGALEELFFRYYTRKSRSRYSTTK